MFPHPPDQSGIPMLRNRIITASLLAPLVILAIIYLSPDGFAILWGLVILGAAWEWSDLAALKGPHRGLFVMTILILMALARLYAIQWAPGELPVWFYASAVAWWAIWGAAFRRSPEKLAERKFSTGARVLAGIFVLFSGWALMVWLRLNFSSSQVLYLVLLIWVADIAAYFTGKRIGFTKLAAAISPGKTVEGVYGALGTAALFALGVGWLVGFEAMTLMDFMFLSLMTVAFSICGDLFESLAKRVRGVKDSGALLPGHGGVLDRIDSLLASVSVFYAGSLLIPIFVQLAPNLEPTLVFAPDENGTAITSGAQSLQEPGISGEERGEISPEQSLSEPPRVQPESATGQEAGK